MKEKLKYLIPVIIILGLVIPKSTSAAIFTGFFDYFVAAFEGIEEFTAPIAQLFIYLGLSYIIGLGTLFISSTLLQLIIQHPEWLSITNNMVVRIGWSFTAGLTNMFFILIFVFIALAIILKIESLQAKKALPKLLIMALLVNFSLIFVGATVDIANVFYRTIVPGDGNLVLDIVDVLAKGGSKTLKNIIDEIIFLAISFIVPVIGPFMQLGFVINLVSTGFVGNVLLWIMQGAMLSMMSGILFTFVFLFLARIFVLQLLAMVAPVAFLCSVLPETKKYWDDWLKMVVEWNVFGVVTLLFLVVGLQGLNSVMPPALLTDVVPTLLEGTGLSWIKMPPSLMYYFFLFVYLSVLLFFSKKYTPMMGDFLINQAKSLGSMIYTKGIKTFGKGAMAGIKHTRGRWKEISAQRREQKGKEKFGTRIRMGVGSRMAKREGIIGKWGTRMMRGTTLETEKAKKVEKEVAQLKSTFGAKGEHLDDALKVGGARFKGPMKAALLQYAAETRGEAGIDKFKDEMGDDKYHESVEEIVKSTPHKVKDLVKNQSELIDDEDTPKKIKNLIRNAMVTTVEDGEFERDEDGKAKDDDVRFIEENIREIDGTKTSELIKDEKGRKKIAAEAAHRKAIRALDANDLKNLSNKRVNKEEFKKRAVRYRTDWNFFRKLSTVKGVDLTKFQDVADENKEVFEEATRINPNFIRAAVAAGKGLMRPWKDYDGKNISGKDALDNVMREIKGEKEVKSSEEIDKEIGQKQEKLNGLLRPRIEITEEELDKKVGTAEKARELSEKSPGRTEDENWFKAKRFLSEKLDKAEEDLYQEKMGDPTILRDIKRGMKQKNREKVETLQKEIKQSKEKLQKRKKQERNEVVIKVKELKLTPDEQTEINNRTNEIFDELSKDKDKEPYKIFERTADFEGFTPDDKALRIYAEEKAKTEMIEDITREKKAPLKKPIVPPVKKEEKLPSWEKEFLNKRNQYQKEVDKYNKSLEEGDKEIEEIDNKLKSLKERIDADSRGEIILSKIERKDIPREENRLDQERGNKLLRRGNIIAKIEKREKIVDEIEKEMKSWEKRPEEEYKEEKELTKSSLRGALKFIPSEIKEPLREGRKARDQLSSSLTDYESLVKEKGILQKKIKLLKVDVDLRKEEEDEFGAGVHTKRKTAVKKTELKNLQGRLGNIIEKRISALQKEINEQKTILIEKKSDIKKEAEKAEMKRKNIPTKKEAIPTKKIQKGRKKLKKIREKYKKEIEKEII